MTRNYTVGNRTVQVWDDAEGLKKITWMDKTYRVGGNRRAGYRAYHLPDYDRSGESLAYASTLEELARRIAMTFPAPEVEAAFAKVTELRHAVEAGESTIEESIMEARRAYADVGIQATGDLRWFEHEMQAIETLRERHAQREAFAHDVTWMRVELHEEGRWREDWMTIHAVDGRPGSDILCFTDEAHVAEYVELLESYGYGQYADAERDYKFCSELNNLPTVWVSNWGGMKPEGDDLFTRAPRTKYVGFYPSVLTEERRAEEIALIKAKIRDEIEAYYTKAAALKLRLEVADE